MDKIMKSDNAGFPELKVIAARRLKPGKERVILTSLQKWLQNNQISTPVITAAYTALDEEECWLTLSEELDGITYLDIYRTE